MTINKVKLAIKTTKNIFNKVFHEKTQRVHAAASSFLIFLSGPIREKEKSKNRHAALCLPILLVSPMNDAQFARRLLIFNE